MIKLKSSLILSFFAALLLVGCNTTSTTEVTEPDVAAESSADDVMEKDDAMMEEDKMTEGESMEKDDVMMEEDEMMESEE